MGRRPAARRGGALPSTHAGVARARAALLRLDRALSGGLDPFAQTGEASARSARVQPGTSAGRHSGYLRPNVAARRPRERASAELWTRARVRTSIGSPSPPEGGTEGVSPGLV